MLEGKKSRILAWVLTFAMLFGLMATGVPTAEAVEGTALTSIGGSLSSGEYYLNEDITLTTDITIASGATVTIDLNGHTLTGVGGSTKTLYVNGGTLTLKDTVGGGKVTTVASVTANIGAVYVTAGGTFTMEGGTISGVTSTKNGAAVYVAGSSSNATFIMNGGTISGNTASSNGGAVYLNALSTFTMNDGTITGNSGKGTVYMTGNASYFTMNGGSISNNTSTTYGGGVYVSAATSTFVMTGGTISDNTASYGGGVYVSSGDFQMSGGTISRNTTNTGNGGGVCIAGSSTRIGTFTMSGGTISGNESKTDGGGIGYNGRGTVTMSGGVITGNAATTYGGGVSVYNVPTTGSYTITFTMTAGAIYKNTATSGAADIYALNGTKSSYTATAAVTLLPSMTVDGSTYIWYTDDSGNRYSEDNVTTEYGVTSGTAIDTSSAVSLIAVEEEEDTFTVTYVYPDNTENLEQKITVGSDSCYNSEDETYDLTYYVPEGYLYGGLYTAVTCATDEACETQCGVLFSYDETDNTTYYVRLVSDSYFQVRFLYAASDTELVNVWPVIAVDCTDYTEIGISIDGTDTPMDEFDTESSGSVGTSKTDADESYAVYQSVTITYPGGDPDSTTATCEDVAGTGFTGYLGVYQRLDLLDYDDTFTVRPYFVTLDGVIVYGRYEKTVDLTETDSPFMSTSARDKGTETKAVTYDYEVSSVLMVYSTCTLTADLDSTYTITKYEDGVAYTQEVNQGATDVEVTYEGKEGYRFAGWFTDEAYTTAADFSEITGDMTVYAKYVSDDYLCVKYSTITSKNILTGIRVLSAVDSKNYSEVGFVYEYDEATTTVKVKSYTSSISGATATKLFGGDVVSGSKIIYNDLSVKSMDADTEITITPYWITLDGTTVYGTSRTLTYTGSAIE